MSELLGADFSPLFTDVSQLLLVSGWNDLRVVHHSPVHQDECSETHYGTHSVLLVELNHEGPLLLQVMLPHGDNEPPEDQFTRGFLRQFTV